MTYAEQFREAFRIGFAPILSDDQLVRLAEACERDDERLTQCVTTIPSAGIHANDVKPVVKCCMASFVMGLVTGGETVGEVYRAFKAIMPQHVKASLGTEVGARWVAVDMWDRMNRGDALQVTSEVCREILDTRKALAA